MVWCGAVRFMRFFYYKITNYTAPCGAVRCGAVRCDYAILQAILIRFLLFVRFMRFGKHSYSQYMRSIRIVILFYYYTVGILS